MHLLGDQTNVFTHPARINYQRVSTSKQETNLVHYSSLLMKRQYATRTEYSLPVVFKVYPIQSTGKIKDDSEKWVIAHGKSRNIT